MNKLIVGLVGDVCAGKSTVAAIFAKQGSAVYDADKAVHALYELDHVKLAVFEIFGPTVFLETKINRKALAEIVFPNKPMMKKLTDITQPIIRAQIEELVAQFANSSEKILLLDAPTLFKVGFDKLCNKIVFVTADTDRRQEWAATKRGWSAVDLIRRDALLKHQILRKHDTITNNEGLTELEARVNEIIASWA